VIPITVLAAGDIRLAGWAEVPDPTPEWWEVAPVVGTPPALVLPLKPPEPKLPKTPRTLWDTIEPEPALTAAATSEQQPSPMPPDWLAALLASPLFIEQKKLGGRAVPADDVFGSLLASLDGAGGKLTATALARKLGLPVFRLRGLLAVVQRVLHIDGFAVLGRDEQSDTVELNRLLLLRQFDLVEEGRP
jgi:hypothetical protein